MKVAIVGSRSFTDFELVKKILADIEDVTEIVSGGAQGADTLAEKYSREILKKEPKVFYADWNNIKAPGAVIRYNKYQRAYNARAGHDRNQKIVDYADLIIIFWDMSSPGTKDTLSKVRRSGKKYVLVNTNTKAIEIQ